MPSASSSALFSSSEIIGRLFYHPAINPLIFQLRDYDIIMSYFSFKNNFLLLSLAIGVSAEPFFH